MVGGRSVVVVVVVGVGGRVVLVVVTVGCVVLVVVTVGCVVLVVLDVVVGRVVLVVLLVEVVVELLVEVVVETLTFGPNAEQRDWARMMSIPNTLTWTAFTVMVAVPGVLFTICSLRISDKIPTGSGPVGEKLGGGLAGKPEGPMMALLPRAPSPSARHWLVTTPSCVVPRMTSATLEELSANPRWLSPATPAPRVQAVSSPTLRTRGIGAGPGVGAPGHGPDERRPDPMGPKPSVGSVADPLTVGTTGDPPMNRGVALPDTESTSALAGPPVMVSIPAASAIALRVPNRRRLPAPRIALSWSRPPCRTVPEGSSAHWSFPSQPAGRERLAGIGLAFYYLCALVLAAVFVAAAAAKIARPPATVKAFATLGVPAPETIARAVPAAELVVAVLLVAVPRAGGVAALVLLVAFTAVLVRALRAGVRTPCRCFGGVREDPISRADVVRNAMLAALAITATAAGEPQAPSPGAAVLVAAVVIAGFAALRVIRR